MKRFVVESTYRQFYVADAELEPPAPEQWNDSHIEQRHNTLKNITALCPVSDTTARVVSIQPDEDLPDFADQPAFQVETTIEVPTGKVGIYGWPWEKMDGYSVNPGTISVRFYGYALDRVDQEEDFYVVQALQKTI